MFAEEFDNCVLDALIMRKLTTGTKVCAVDLPPSCQFGESWTDPKELLATLTDAKVFREVDCMNFRYPSWMESKPATKSMLGSCRRAIVGANDTVILICHLSMEDIEELRAEEIKETEELRSEELQLTSSSPRITDEDCLEGDMGDWLYAVLKVGGASRADVGAMKSIVTRALKAAKAAVKEGIVPGGGIAFLNASKELENLQITNYGQKIGVQIIQDALKMPVLTIASSAGIEGSVVLGKLLEQDNPNLGYDATKGEYIDMIEHGIVDPLKVVRTTFVGATSMFLKKLRKGELDKDESDLDMYTRLVCNNLYAKDAGTIQGKAI